MSTNSAGTYKFIPANLTVASKDGTYNVLFTTPNHQLLAQHVPVQVANGVPQLLNKCPPGFMCPNMVYDNVHPCIYPCMVSGAYKVQDGKPPTIHFSPTN